MKKNKKIPVSILLLSIYALFMCQEIMINQVLCFKDNGDADVELAIFGLQCECKNEDPIPTVIIPEQAPYSKYVENASIALTYPWTAPG